MLVRCQANAFGDHTIIDDGGTRATFFFIVLVKKKTMELLAMESESQFDCHRLMTPQRLMTEIDGLSSSDIKVWLKQSFAEINEQICQATSPPEIFWPCIFQSLQSSDIVHVHLCLVKNYEWDSLVLINTGH